MNYTESNAIFEEIKKSKRVFVNCHRNPDPDSVGSALAMYQVLNNLGKEVRVICSTPVGEYLKFFRLYATIEQEIDFSKVDYKEGDLFIVLDSSSWDFASSLEEEDRPPIPLVVIDHHKTNLHFGTLNLVDFTRPSLAEILFKVFKDWKITMTKDIAQCILSGIIGDTGAFRFPVVDSQTLRAGAELMELGADKDEAIFNIYFSTQFSSYKFWGLLLNAMEFDEEHKFIWTAMPFEVYEENGGKKGFKDSFATNFLQSVKGTDFGIAMVEEEKGIIYISLRSRTGIDVSKLAIQLNGGGHKYAAGGKIEGMEYKKAIKKVLDIARNFVRNEKPS